MLSKKYRCPLQEDFIFYSLRHFGGFVRRNSPLIKSLGADLIGYSIKMGNRSDRSDLKRAFKKGIFQKKISLSGGFNGLQFFESYLDGFCLAFHFGQNGALFIDDLRGRLFNEITSEF